VYEIALEEHIQEQMEVEILYAFLVPRLALLVLAQVLTV
jgi:hypothetical protein